MYIVKIGMVLRYIQSDQLKYTGRYTGQFVLLSFQNITLINTVDFDRQKSLSQITCTLVFLCKYQDLVNISEGRSDIPEKRQPVILSTTCYRQW